MSSSSMYDDENILLSGEIAAETVISSHEVYDHVISHDLCEDAINTRFNGGEEQPVMNTNGDVLWQEIDGTPRDDTCCKLSESSVCDAEETPTKAPPPTSNTDLHSKHIDIPVKEKGLTVESKREKNRLKKREQRQNPKYREKEKLRARARMKEKREDETYRDHERQKDRERRKLLRRRINVKSSSQLELNHIKNKSYAGTGLNNGHFQHTVESPATNNTAAQIISVKNESILEQSYAGIVLDNGQLQRTMESSASHNSRGDTVNGKNMSSTNASEIENYMSNDRTIQIENQFYFSDAYS